jgi:hypothetical protein
VHEVDTEIGRLEAGLAKLNLPVDVIVLADHGMTKVEGDWINLDQYFDASLLETSAESFIYAKSEADATQIYDSRRCANGPLPLACEPAASAPSKRGRYSGEDGSREHAAGGNARL